MVLNFIIFPIFVGVATYSILEIQKNMSRRRLYQLIMKLRRIQQKTIIMNENEDWIRNSELVLQSLRDIKKDINSIKDDISQLKVKVGQLEVRSGFYGFLGGALALIPTIVIWIFSNK